MATVPGQGTTFNLPNYSGELYAASPEDTPFLSIIGGLSGGETVSDVVFSWQGYDLRDPQTDRQRLEGADAPTAEHRSRFAVTNAVEIRQEAVEVSYTKQAAVSQLAALPAGSGNPVTSELDWQIEQGLKVFARDINATLLNGTYALPGNNSTARRTRGLLQAIATNRVSAATVLGTGLALANTGDSVTSSAHGLANGTVVAISNVVTTTLAAGQYFVVSATTNTFKLSLTRGGSVVALDADGTANVSVHQPLAEDNILDLIQGVWDNGGIRESETATIMVGSTQKRALTRAFITDAGYTEATRNVGGVNVQTIETDFGRLNIVLERNIPSDTAVIASLEQCAPAHLRLAGGQSVIAEPLAKTGSADRVQMYTEVGLRYGNELAHGVITGLRY